MKIRCSRPIEALRVALLTLVAILAAGRPCPAAEPARLSVAVMEFKVIGNPDRAGDGALVAERLLGALGESQVFALQERVLLKKVLAEQQLALTGLVDEGKHVAMIGKLYGLDAVISGSLFRWGNSITVTARLIDAQTGASSRTAVIRTSDLASLPGRINDLGRILAGQTSQAEIDRNQVAVMGLNNSGANAKMQLGATTWTEPLTGLEFVLIKGGCYRMGLAEQERQLLLQQYGARAFAKLYADESPPHEVCVDDFWLARHETSNRQFRLFRPEHDSLAYRGRTMNDDQQPAVYTSWEEARDFAAWLSGKYPDRAFRLPTEAEWEKGCRVGSETPRFWGTNADEACRFANVHDRSAEKENRFGWPPHACDDGFVVTAPVGSLAPNPAGLYDMLGNVWEWTQDIYRSDGYRQHGRVDPVITEGGTSRVRRGGSWNNADGGIRCANRSERQANQRNNRTGFRLLMQSGGPAFKEAAEPGTTNLPLAELELDPDHNTYRFKFTNPAATTYALVISSPMPPRQKNPDYSGIWVSLKVFDGDQLLLDRFTAPALARFGTAGDSEYGAFFAIYHAPSELPVGSKLTATVEIIGPLADFLARRGGSKLALLPAP